MPAAITKLSYLRFIIRREEIVQFVNYILQDDCLCYLPNNTKNRQKMSK